MFAALALLAAPALALAAPEPFYRATGEHERSYLLKPAGETRPYRIYVPTTWKPGMHLPLVVALHGAGADQGRLFQGTPRHPGVLQQEAQARGYIVVAPLGDKEVGADIAYGNTLHAPWSDDVAPSAEDARRNALSELDVLTVLDRTVAEYGVDKRRIYLMGNSMGEIGGLWLAQQRPRDFCAIALAGGPLNASEYPFARTRYLSGAMIINGDRDTDALEPNRAMADGFKAVGVDTQFYIVPFTDHGAALFHATPQAFDFFDKHRCGG
jgi:poly(3-hydroxybutyrate) depolymerase